MRDAHAPHADALPARARHPRNRRRPLSATGVSRDPFRRAPPKIETQYLFSHTKKIGAEERKKKHAKWQETLFRPRKTRDAPGKAKAQFPGRGAMPRATKAWSAGSNLRRLFGGRAALRRARGEARETSASGPSARRGEIKMGGETLYAPRWGNGERVASADRGCGHRLRDRERGRRGGERRGVVVGPGRRDGVGRRRVDPRRGKRSTGGGAAVDVTPRLVRRVAPSRLRVRGAGSAGRVRGALVRGRGDHGLAQGARAGVPPA